MPTLTYWVANNLDEPACYHQRARTRKALTTWLEEAYGPSGWQAHYRPPRKVSVTYTCPYDLMLQCLGPAPGHWEAHRSDRFGWSEGEVDYRPADEPPADA